VIDTYDAIRSSHPAMDGAAIEARCWISVNLEIVKSGNEFFRELIESSARPSLE